ncbi:hypothetical protein EDB19DRAFT_1705269 [Suillus lakei]|nr:hypothetical protein EDB19DRAFT_1705269 [Suillus lakei]
MFRALLLFLPFLKYTKEHSDVKLAVSPEAVFTTAVGHSSKRTLASWHVTTPEEVVEHILYLVGKTPPREEVKGYL